MKTIRLTVLAITMSLVAVSVPISSQAAKHVKKSVATHKADANETFIRQAYAYQASGIEKFDVNIATSYTTDDFIAVGKDGRRMTKNMCITELYGAFKQAAMYNASIRVRQKLKSFQITPTTATVIVAAHVWIQIPNPDSNQLPRQTDLSGGTTRDIWIRTSHGWAQQSSQWISDGE